MQKEYDTYAQDKAELLESEKHGLEQRMAVERTEKVAEMNIRIEKMWQTRIKRELDVSFVVTVVVVVVVVLVEPFTFLNLSRAWWRGEWRVEQPGPSKCPSTFPLNFCARLFMHVYAPAAASRLRLWVLFAPQGGGHDSSQCGA